MSGKAFFLDRDGVIIRQVEYLKDPDEVELIPGAVEALRTIHRNGFLAVVVSNQSGIARKRFTREDLDKVQARLYELLAAEGEKLDGFYFCPHDPHVENCRCRKPKPGMILDAARDLDVDVGRSFMIGDRPADLETGRAAGCRGWAMTRTGYGERLGDEAERSGYPVYADLLTAVEALLRSIEDRPQKEGVGIDG